MNEKKKVTGKGEEKGNREGWEEVMGKKHYMYSVCVRLVRSYKS